MSQFKLNYTGQEVNKSLEKISEINYTAEQINTLLGRIGTDIKWYQHILTDNQGVVVTLIVPNRNTPLTSSGTDLLADLHYAYFKFPDSGMSSYCAFAYSGSNVLPLYKLNGTHVDFNSANYTDQVIRVS